MQPPSPTPSTSAPQRPLVLVVDDDAIVRQFLIEALAALDCEALSAASGEQALALRPQRALSAMIVDLEMPPPAGIALLLALRRQRDSNAATATAIALSGDLPRELAAELCRAGFDLALQKPIDIAALGRALAARQPVASFGRAHCDYALLDLDDAAAERATGSLEIALGLRALLATDLERELEALHAAVDADDRKESAALLHRLRAACRFCGAAALEHALDQLAQAHDSIAARVAWDRVEECAQRLSAKIAARR
jgi:two-component system sensor histidine kinase BarA